MQIIGIRAAVHVMCAFAEGNAAVSRRQLTRLRVLRGENGLALIVAALRGFRVGLRKEIARSGTVHRSKNFPPGSLLGP